MSHFIQFLCIKFRLSFFLHIISKGENRQSSNMNNKFNLFDFKIYLFGDVCTLKRKKTIPLHWKKSFFCHNDYLQLFVFIILILYYHFMSSFLFIFFVKYFILSQVLYSILVSFSCYNFCCHLLLSFFVHIFFPGNETHSIYGRRRTMNRKYQDKSCRILSWLLLPISENQR
jgi:hypothetical protein